MKAALLATAAVLAATASAAPAKAQFMDGVAKEWTQIASWGKQAADMAKGLQGDLMRLRQLEATYQAMTRVTDLGSAVSALNMLGIRNPLPVNPYAVQSLMSGQGGAQGMLGSLSSLYTGALNQNRLYETPGGTWIDQQINQQGGGIAGAQAVALQLYQSAAERVPYLQQLQARIDTAADPSEREALIARLGAEQAYIQNSQVQAQTLGNFMAAQFQLRDQQREERLQGSIDEALALAAAKGWR
jgi:type IV secretion system protein VirB5